MADTFSDFDFSRNPVNDDNFFGTRIYDSDVASVPPIHKKSSIMHKCILKNDIGTLKQLLSSGKRDCLNDLDHSGRTPFHVALQHANAKALYLLLYYPLIHPSRLFATLDWTDILEDFSPYSFSEGEIGKSIDWYGPEIARDFDCIDNGYKISEDKDSPDWYIDDENVNYETGNCRSNMQKNAIYDAKKSQNNTNSNSSADRSFKLGNRLLKYWDEFPSMYIRSALTLGEGGYMHGCGIREVEDLYEEHYKFLVGEPHKLERAAREYTAKYSRLYARHPANLSVIEGCATRVDSDEGKEVKISTIGHNTVNRAYKQTAQKHFGETNKENVTGVGLEGNTYSRKSSRTSYRSSTGTESLDEVHGVTGIVDIRDCDVVDEIPPKIGEIGAENDSKGMIPLEMVDMLATFDKTSPLHLLFSNVYIPSYRDNMLKCFRILVQYFNKSIDYSKVFREYDAAHPYSRLPTMGFNHPGHKPKIFKGTKRGTPQTSDSSVPRPGSARASVSHSKDDLKGKMLENDKLHLEILKIPGAGRPGCSGDLISEDVHNAFCKDSSPAQTDLQREEICRGKSNVSILSTYGFSPSSLSHSSSGYLSCIREQEQFVGKTPQEDKQGFFYEKNGRPLSPGSFLAPLKSKMNNYSQKLLPKMGSFNSINPMGSDTAVEDGVQWLTKTLCADSAEVINESSRRDRNVMYGLYTSNSGDFDPESGMLNMNKGSGKVEPETAIQEPRIKVLHGAIISSALWLRPSTSWEAFIQRRDFTRSTILHKVCNVKDVDLIRLLLCCGYSPLVVNEAGDMPVHISVESKDPVCLLTMLHATFEALYNSRAEHIQISMELTHKSHSRLQNAFQCDENDNFSLFMRSLSTSCYHPKKSVPPKEGFPSNKHEIEGHTDPDNFCDRTSQKIRKIHHNSSIEGDESHIQISTDCDGLFQDILHVNEQQILFDEMLLLTEQLTYRAIRSSSWECLVAILSYNEAITYHIMSNPSFMHRLINMAASVGKSEEFMKVANFVVSTILEPADGSSAGDNCGSSPEFPFDYSIFTDCTTIFNDTKKRDKVSGAGFKGCGIPEAPLSKMEYLNRVSGSQVYVEPKPFKRDTQNAIETIISRFRFTMGESASEKISERKKTWIITHPTCLHHLATPEPVDAPNKRHRLVVTYPENPTRLEAIISNDNGILRSDTLESVKLLHSPPPASLADILRVHNWSYINKLLSQVQIARRRWVANSYWPILADGDTPVTPHSWNAALYAAGSVIAAVDAVCTNACRNAFCAVRPPGHHLGTWGGAQSSNFVDEDFASGSQGFCLINNVAIGAAYAKYTYASRGIRKIAIIDFDVHHGNGTEQIIRNVGPKVIKCRFSTNTGESEDAETDTHSVYHHWLGWHDEKDREEIFFASIHAYDGIFYPGTGKSCTLYDDVAFPRIINVAVPEGTTSAEFKFLFEVKISPYLYHFKPDLIFISAGFDGHYRDSVTYGFTKYTEKDFYYVTELLVSVANSVCDGRVVSVLEGGYNTKLNTLSPFARSVLEHVSALCHTDENTTYPFMHGEYSIDLLMLPLVNNTKDNFESRTNIADLACGELDERILSKVDKLRESTDLLISKVYSLDKITYCKLARLHERNVAYRCCMSSLELSGNCFLSFYSRNFHSLYNITNSVYLKYQDILSSGNRDMFGDESKANREAPLDWDVEDILFNLKAQNDIYKTNYFLQSSEWFRNIKIRSLEQNKKVAEMLFKYFKRNAQIFRKKCHIHA